MKTTKFWKFMVVATISLLPLFSWAINCDSIELAKNWKSSEAMQTWTRDGIPGSIYTVTFLNSDKKIVITYGEEKIVIDFDYTCEARIVTSREEFLEVAILNKNKGNRSYLFVKGVEIRKIVSGIKEDEYFRARPYKNDLLFEFEGGKYGKCNIEKKEFCR